MYKIPFVKKLITYVIAGLVIGESTFRFCATYLRTWLPIRQLSIIPLLLVIAAIIYVFIWQARKTNKPTTLAFWQGLIRYGVAFDLAEFGWSKICHQQLVMPLYQLDLPYRSLTPPQLFWTFYSHSYLFGCIIGGLQIVGAMLLLFHRTRLVGVFVLLPILANILLMDIFYQIGDSVVVHASIMMSGVLYFLFIEFDRLKEFFFVAKSNLPVMHLPKLLKMAIRLSIIYIPLLFIAMHDGPNKYPQLTGKYKVRHLRVDQQDLDRVNCADSALTIVYFDIRNSCVFEFNAQQRRWYGKYTKDNDHLKISWYTPGDKPVFNGIIIPADAGRLMLRGSLGTDSMSIILQKMDPGS
ncbi:hypothetical protein [Chitinophaga sp. CF418]|uniref:hypothetical protein n=1 Tax=Chitinophaga sp. CF418 TaxID=1855287 RepID=UPI00091129D8|nr:hypothetical protein [Chitinophaga sp. CF418]SHN24197.1 hypothetical protein SAMN05216311_107231 [Chitinophaga sp. CF418]